jgi:uncharacterized protein YbjT (DUF2867 family)
MILVTGATGNVGGELVRQLAASGQQVRALIREAASIDVPAGVETAIGDLNEPDSLRVALKDVRGVFLLGGYRDMAGVMTAIRQALVERVVLLTSRSVIGGKPDNAIANMWMISEESLRSSGVSWTILRPSGFMSNALRWIPQLRAGDLVRAPFAAAPIATIDPADIAAVAGVDDGRPRIPSVCAHRAGGSPARGSSSHPRGSARTESRFRAAARRRSSRRDEQGDAVRNGRCLLSILRRRRI